MGMGPPTEAFGQTEGDYRDIFVSYGILIIRDYSVGYTYLYSVGNGSPTLIHPSSPVSFTVERVDSSHVRITKVGSSSYNALRARAVEVG